MTALFYALPRWDDLGKLIVYRRQKCFSENTTDPERG
jgi:hypothetical protein